MAENEWIPLATAAALREDDNWLKQIRRALVLGAVTARGVIPPGMRPDVPPKGELVEITAHEFANLGIDFLRSNLVPVDQARWRVTVYAALEVRRADVERLAKAQGPNEKDADVLAPSRVPDSCGNAPESVEGASLCDASGLSETGRALAKPYFDDLRWPLRHALNWIARRKIEALTLTPDELAAAGGRR